MTTASGGDGGQPPGDRDDLHDVKERAKQHLKQNPELQSRLGRALSIGGAIDTIVKDDPGGSGGPAFVEQRVGMSDDAGNPGYATINDKVTTLRTGGFAGCVGIILLGPGTTRTLAHVSSWHYPVTRSAWPHIEAFRKLAAAAHTAHVYHWPGYWEIGDRDGDAFVKYFGLTGNVVVHGKPELVEVDPTHKVTP